MFSKLYFVVVFVLGCCVVNIFPQQVINFPLYEKVDDLPAGKLVFTGSDSMKGLFLEWAQAFGQMYPQVSIIFNGGDSDTGFESLLEDPKSTLAPMSKEMSIEQLTSFRKRYGYEPIAIRVAIDAIGLYVHKDNPLVSIELKDLRDLFSAEPTRLINNWGDIGAKGSWAKKAIQPLALNERSGTYELFNRLVLGVGDQAYRSNVIIFNNPWDLVNGLSQNILGLGYCGVGVVEYWQNLKDKQLKLVLIAKDGRLPVEPTRMNCLNGDYPLARSLYIYIGNRPGDPISRVQEAFFRYIFSQQGQNVVIRQGMFTLESSMAEKMFRLSQGRLNHF